ncbi:amidohydrolase [Nocardioides eburneiflavus]|uniref:Amidohydrolase n=1 Tax=Nocardioides eburneiflavus TaxID=2518372 RepID=A0A4Z1CD69_9ACTN|nr:amidohydrolase [Nocardioides eburneiflavus]TGN65756.1 amidohydrolase [Nocardioides eburneiflavus]
MTTEAPKLFTGARIFTAQQRPWAEAMVVAAGRLLYVGDDRTARRIAGATAQEHRVEGKLVLPGFVDAHAHIVSTGEVSEQIDLSRAADLAEVHRRIKVWADAHPGEPRIRAHSWEPASILGERPTRQMLDAVVADRPVYVQTYDFHSIWLNSAAIAEVGLNSDTTDTVGGKVWRDENGLPTGYVDETAMHAYVWPFLEDLQTDADLDRHLASALRGYRNVGVTAAVDMGLHERDLAAMARAEQAGELTARIVAHWRIAPSGRTGEDLAEVAHAAELASRHHTDRLRVTGIKLMLDGTVDGCTAALGVPYVDGTNADPIWDTAALCAVVTAADAAGLQVAMHAIGDEAIRQAITAVESAVEANGPLDRRHRIEHLEVVENADIQRLAALGLTASMQPVHADPAIQENWRAMLGDDRVDRGFPWSEMTDAGAPLAFGTDSPTAPYPPLRNMFIAATRRSAFDPTLTPNVEKFALPLADAIGHATRDAAWACRAEDQFGALAPGRLADFVVVDRDVFEEAPESLLEAGVVSTVVGGEEVRSA